MNTQSTVGSHRTNAILTGIFYIIATSAAILALPFYEPVLFQADYLTGGAGQAQSVIVGALCELLVVCAAAGTAIMLFPYVRRYNESLGLAYLCFRLAEAMLILVGLVSVLAMVTLSQSYSSAISPDTAAYLVSGSAMKAVHDWTFILGPNFMLGINTFIYSMVFTRTNLIPKKIAAFGVVGAVLIFIAALLEMFGIIQQISIEGALFAFPIFLYEMILAARLIIKGFNSKSILLQQA
ncbi:MAG: DUF4386 domain-containing protein [Lewinellaceae bacterium]|nr:DUF4386 domain-containing protein [Lewinellaceae bacterium]